MSKYLDEKMEDVVRLLDMGMSDGSIAEEVGCSVELVRSMRKGRGKISENTTENKPQLLEE